MTRELTRLEKGIFVTISKEELVKLKETKGFLSRMDYPESYEDIAQENEIGRFLTFRFLSF